MAYGVTSRLGTPIDEFIVSEINIFLLDTNMLVTPSYKPSDIKTIYQYYISCRYKLYHNIALVMIMCVAQCTNNMYSISTSVLRHHAKIYYFPHTMFYLSDKDLQLNQYLQYFVLSDKNLSPLPKLLKCSN